jgi:hypothetical protein
MKKVILFFAVISVSLSSFAQNAQPEKALSFSIGVAKWKEFEMANAKIAYERGHFALSADYSFTYKEMKRSLDNSQDDYQLQYGTVSGRAYTGKLGRGFFAELGVGGSFNVLKTTFSDNNTIRKFGFAPVATAGLGYRYGKKPTGFFAELSCRSAFALSENHLFTTSEAPANSTKSKYSYHSFHLDRFTQVFHPSLSIGYSF